MGLVGLIDTLGGEVGRPEVFSASARMRVAQWCSRALSAAEQRRWREAQSGRMPSVRKKWEMRSVG